MMTKILSALAVVLCLLAQAAAQSTGANRLDSAGYSPEALGGTMVSLGLTLDRDEVSPDGKRRVQLGSKSVVSLLVIYNGCDRGRSCASVEFLNPFPTSSLGLDLTPAAVNRINQDLGVAWVTAEAGGITALHWGALIPPSCEAACQTGQLRAFAFTMKKMMESYADMADRREVVSLEGLGPLAQRATLAEASFAVLPAGLPRTAPREVDGFAEAAILASVPPLPELPGSSQPAFPDLLPGAR